MYRENVLKISAQSIQWFRNFSLDKKVVAYPLSYLDKTFSNILEFLFAELVFIYPMSVRQSGSQSTNLVTTTTPKRLDGLSWNFQET